MLFDLLADPDRFFERELEAGGFLRPTAVVAVLGVVSALSGIPIVEATFAALPDEAAAFAGIGYAFAIVGGFLGAFFVWLLYAVVFLAIARIAFDGDGSFQETLRATAWGFLPAIVAAAASGVAAYYVFQSVTFPSDPAQIQAFASQLQRRPPFLAAGVLGVFLTLVQAFVWTFGVRHAQGIDLRDAGITVGVPVAVTILWQVYNLA